MTRISPKLLLAVAGLLIAGSSHAQTMTPTDETAVQQALNRGQLIYAFDQAAWHATDALLADAKRLGRTGDLGAKFGGWIVRPKDSETLEVLFFEREPGSPNVLYRAITSASGDVVRSHGFVDENSQQFDAQALRMITARRAGIEAMMKQGILRCASAQFNSIVLPPETPEGPIPVYLLSPQTDLAKVPFGGHARVLIAADGTVGPVHSFTKGCLDLPTRNAKNAPVMSMATLVLDPHPTEVSVFTMLAAGLPLYIATPDRRIWILDSPDGKAKISLLQSDK
ncbi:hypothetical protein [Novosphingobium sp.]|uniref:hypothetical protein n=1 Tax=Novosphingobium sp. TaxID=1874826 RepID=UPI0025F302B0|nr:hypothetical protein [Novosphingobium sp.]MCC6925397.1 hypothetical protein [Novosphingobium sp.]